MARFTRWAVVLSGLVVGLALLGTQAARAGPSATVYLPLVMNSHPSSVSSAKPPTDPSYYVSSTSPSDAFHLGCLQGEADARISPHPNSLVILDFGGQLADGSGSLLINGTAVSNAQVAAIAEAFSHGYWYCTGDDLTSTLWLGIGTNNSYYDVSASGGATWARVVAAVAASNHANGYDSQVVAEGANDIEPDWESVADSRAWVDGYAAQTSSFYVNYGSADGCPDDTYLDAFCSNGWTQDDVWYVSWGARTAQALPEIYAPVNAGQWTMIGREGAWYHGSSGKIQFSGPLDTYPLWPDSNSADQAWEQFTTDLNQDPSTAQSMPYSVEIQSQG